MRTCKKCSEEKLLVEFNLSGWKDHRRWECRTCESGRKKIHYENNPEPYKIRGRRTPEEKRAEYRRNPGPYKARARKRQLALKGVQSDPSITIEALYSRHGAICYLCDEAIDTALRYPDRWAGTIEHVVAIFNGGQNTWNNVKPAHSYCNRRKGVK